MNDDEIYDQICPSCGDRTNAYEAFIIEGPKILSTIVPTVAQRSRKDSN